MSFQLPQKSLDRLAGVHPVLVKLVLGTAASCDLQFVVTEGVRTLERQKELLATGKSKTMRSRHLTGHAVDLAVWEDRDADKVVDADEISWKFPQYQALAAAVKAEAARQGIPIEWGGDWLTFKDGPHFQLPWESYP
ncbi:M15 family metallopeptidase [uncultured Rhodoferax sp.]|uniref:M15 family metallopeptidase n=1 Tax=uncultured Rhodoferax sp. TaxID=223188 RepID=UPI0025FA9BB9|nr:M15 family metallopeptidase [uncultured Rhodoferax sp.]